LQPLLDAANTGVAVVIDDSLSPCPTKANIIGLGQDNGVFDGNRALIVVAIQYPRLHLPACQFACMHAQMKRMAVMVHRLTNVLQALAQLCLVEQNRLRLR
jgi:hypothetical protein